MNVTRGGATAAPGADRPSRFGPQIYGYLKERLLDGVYECGSKLNINEIREEFGTSRHPVLDAMRMLDNDGLVEVLPQVGCRVKVYTPEDVEDFFRLFGGIEGLVAGMAAQRRTAAQIERLNGLVILADDEQISAAEAYKSMNGRFHGVVHDMAASPIINETCSRHWDLADFMVNTVGGVSSIAVSLEERLARHQEIAAAIEAGDSDGAAEAAEVHVLETTRDIIERMKSR
ncbi:GntR family transcriptional regulator [Rhodococcus hoagii]|nr:GntR family transcriptional regulator [Prescottella equi]